jgi:hypothetical protein
MSSEEMIDAANGQVELPEGVVLEDVKIKVEAGHVVTYSKDGEQVAVYNLATGETHYKMGVKEYENGDFLRCFYDFNWDYDGYTPSLEERAMLEEQICTMVEGSFAVNWALREGLYSTSNGQLKAPGYDLRTVANRLAFYNDVILPKYREAVANGTLFADDGVIPLDGGVQIIGQLPDVYLAFEYNKEITTGTSPVNGKETYVPTNADWYRWVKQVYDKDKTILTITIGMDEKMAKMMQERLVGGPVLGSLRDLTLDQITSYGIGDMSGMPLLNALGVKNLGPNQSNAINGELNPDTTVQQGFIGLDPMMYNRK